MLVWLTLSADAQERLDFEAALREATSRAPAVELAEGALRARLGELRSAYALLDNPEAEVERLPGETELRVGVPVPIALQPVTRASAAGAGRDAAHLQARVSRSAAVLEVGEAWLDARRALDRDALLQGTLDLARRSREGARKLLETGEIGLVDAAVTEAAAASAEAVASRARQEAVRLSLALEALLGRQPTGSVLLGDWPDLDVPGERDPGSLPAALAAAREADRARAAATLAAQDLVPTPLVTAGWTAGGTDGAIVGVAVELPLFAPGTGTLRQARGERDLLAAEAERARLSAQAEWTAGVRELEAAERAWAATRVDGLDQALDALASAFAAGEYSLTDYVTRRDAVLAGLEARIDARHRLEAAKLALWELAGELPVGGTP